MFHGESLGTKLACAALFLLATAGAGGVAGDDLKPSAPLSLQERQRLNEQAWRLAVDKKYRAAEEIWTRLCGPDSWRVRLARREEQQMNLARQAVGDDEVKLKQFAHGMALMDEASRAFNADDHATAIVKASACRDVLRNIGEAVFRLYDGPLLSKMATSHERLYHYTEAERLWKLSLDSMDEGLLHVRAYAFSRLASIKTQTGKYADAAAYFDKAEDLFALQVKDDLFSTDSGGLSYRSYGMHLSERGVLCICTGDYAKAFELYEQSATVYQRLPGLPTSITDLGNVLFNQAGLLLQHPGANSWLHQDPYARAKRQLREVADRLGRIPGARRQVCRARLLYMLSNIHLRLREHEEYLAVRREALALLDKEKLDDAVLRALLLREANLLGDEKLEHVEARLREAADVWMHLQGARGEGYRECIFNLAFVVGLQEKYAEAMRLEEALLSSAFEDADSLFLLHSERQRLAFAARVERLVKEYLDYALQCKSDPAEAYRRVVSYKGMAGLSKGLQQVALKQPELRGLLDEQAGIRSRLTALWAVAAEEGATAGDLKRLVDRRDEIERTLLQKSDSYRAYRERMAVLPEQVAAALPDGAVFVDVFPYSHRRFKHPPDPALPYPFNILNIQEEYVAFVIRRNEPVVMVRLGDGRSWLWWHATEWSWAVQRKDAAEEREKGQKLAQLFWEPLAPHIRNASTVVVCTEGEFSRLPIHALPTRTGKRLLDDVSITYVSSARQLVDLNRGPEKPGAPSLLAVGGIDYGRAPGSQSQKPPSALPGPTFPSEFASLPFTLPEAESARRTFRATQPAEGRRDLILDGNKATRERLREELRPNGPGWSYLHFGGHGYFADAQYANARRVAVGDGPRSSPSDWFRDQMAADAKARYEGWLSDELTTPYCSGIALAGANNPDARGVFTADEISDLDLRGTELVMLSACYSGMGKKFGAEGAVGLRRALHIGGARRVVASLWAANDSTAELLMRQFYSNLWERRLRPQEALRQAQIYVRDHGPGDSDHPYFWAGFFMSGDPRDVPRPGESASPDMEAPGKAEDVGRPVRGEGESTVVAAAAAGVVGLGLLAGAIVWRRRRRAGLPSCGTPTSASRVPPVSTVAPAGEYYYAENKRRVGPVSLAQLRRLVRAGRLRLNDMVLRKGATKWVPVSAVLQATETGQ
jgi:CHAT domain-containing protein